MNPALETILEVNPTEKLEDANKVVLTSLDADLTNDRIDDILEFVNDKRFLGLHISLIMSTRIILDMGVNIYPEHEELNKSSYTIESIIRIYYKAFNDGFGQGHDSAIG